MKANGIDVKATIQKLAPQEFDGYINELEVDGFLVQSREYSKLIEGKPETKTAYKICCNNIVVHGKETNYGKA